MSTPESHELESFFEKLTQPPPEHTAHGHGDPAEEFNALFRKLSALDELNWAPEAHHPAPPKRALTAAARQSPAADTLPEKQAAAPAAAQAAMPAPTLTQEEAGEIASIADSREAQATAPEAAQEATPAPAMPTPRQVAPRPKRRARAAAAVVSAEAVTAAAAPRPGMLDRAGRVLKITTVSLALFGIGLGAVWAALTLPQRVNQAQPAMAGRAIPGGGRAMADAPVTAPAQGTELPATAAELQVTEVETKPAGPVPLVRTDQRDSVAAANAAATAGAPVTANAPAAPQAETATAPMAPPAPEPASVQTAETGGFALQVGACASEQCLANYRSLLSSFVTPESIRVIAAPSGAGSTVQRVRVAPLDLAQARKLKVAMAADARLRNAYVITLN